MLTTSLACTTFAVALVAQTPPDQSQATPGEHLSEIVVTAQRAPETLQQTPISLTVLTSQQLTDFGVRNFADYVKSVPNMSFGMGGGPFGGPAYGYSSTRQMVIRGVAGANTTSLYLDDTPIPNVVDPRVLDLERVEILRGPQGTLFGASSMGGTVRLITKMADPATTSGKVDAQGFQINAGGAGYDVSGSINLPVATNTAALRLSLFDTFAPGYFTKVFGVATVPGVDFAPGTQVAGSSRVGDTHESGGAASMLFTPQGIPGLSIVPAVMLQRIDVSGYPLAENSPSNFTQIRPFDVPESSLAQWQFYAITAKYSASFGDFISSTGYFHRYSRDVEDGTMWLATFQSFYYSPLPYLATTVPQTYDSRGVTQELRYQSHLQPPVQFIIGLFYRRTTTTDSYSYLVPGLNAASGGTVGTDNIFQLDEDAHPKQSAAFADITYAPTRNVELSAGVRKAWLADSGNQEFEQPANLDANAAQSFAQRQRPVTPRFVAKYKFDQDNMTYVSAAKGFRIGGENSPVTGPCANDERALGLPVGAPLPYYSDSLWSYELGAKDLWHDRNAATRVAAYYIDWRNVQQTLLLPACGIPVLLNAGAARSFGAEGELAMRVTSRLQVDAGLGYEDAEITEANTLPNGKVLGFPVGTPLSGVPTWTASLRAEYSTVTAIGEILVRGEYSFVGSSLSLANGGAGLRRDAYSLMSLRGGLHLAQWTTTLFIENLFNKAANYGDVVLAAGLVPGQTRLVVAQPRTVGLEVQWSLDSH